MQVRPFPLKDRMFFDMQDNVEITGGAAKRSCLAQSGKPDACAVFYSGGNLRIDRALPFVAALAFAFRTGIRNNAAHSLARRTSPRHAEESLLIAHLAPPAAGTATHRRFTSGRARASAIFAGLVAPDRDLRFFPEHCLLKPQRQILAQVRSTLGSRAAAPASEQVSESEEISKNVIEILERARIEAARARAPDSRVAEAIIGSAFVRVCQNSVGLAALLELLFSVGIIWIAVRVILQRQFAVGAPQFLLTGLAGNSKYFVVIAFYVTCQSSPFRFLSFSPFARASRFRKKRMLSAPLFQCLEFRAIFTIAGRSKRSFSL